MSGGHRSRRRLFGGLLGEIAAGLAACRASERNADRERAELARLAAELDACGAELWQATAQSAGVPEADADRGRILRALHTPAVGRG